MGQVETWIRHFEEKESKVNKSVWASLSSQFALRRLGLALCAKEGKSRWHAHCFVFVVHIAGKRRVLPLFMEAE